MKPQPRIRKTVKWGGAVLALFLAALWATNRYWRVGYAFTRDFEVAFDRGCLILNWYAPPPPVPVFEDARDFEIRVRVRWEWGLSEWPVGVPVPSLPNWATLKGHSWVIFPLWWLPLITALGTALAWRLDTLARRRADLTRCPRCRYDRSGLSAGAVCPECGAAAPQHTAAR